MKEVERKKPLQYAGFLLPHLTISVLRWEASSGIVSLDDKSCLHLLFISTSGPKWKRSDGIWFITSSFGHDQLCLGSLCYVTCEGF